MIALLMTMLATSAFGQDRAMERHTAEVLEEGRSMAGEAQGVFLAPGAYDLYTWTADSGEVYSGKAFVTGEVGQPETWYMYGEHYLAPSEVYGDSVELIIRPEENAPLLGGVVSHAAADAAVEGYCNTDTYCSSAWISVADWQNGRRSADTVATDPDFVSALDAMGNPYMQLAQIPVGGIWFGNGGGGGTIIGGGGFLPSASPVGIFTVPAAVGSPTARVDGMAWKEMFLMNREPVALGVNDFLLFRPGTPANVFASASPTHGGIWEYEYDFISEDAANAVRVMEAADLEEYSFEADF